MRPWAANTRTGWHSTAIEAADEAAARAEREARDLRLSNRYPVADPGDDHRWHGHLAEALFGEWLAKHRVLYHHDGGPNDAPDFTVAGATIELKGLRVKCGRMREDWAASVAVKHSVKAVDIYVFTCVEEEPRRFLVLGALPRSEFLALAEVEKWAHIFTDTPTLAVEAWKLYAPETLAAALGYRCAA